ncbi:hypothetical protein HK405_004169, partial [Cladochytrium tenue]
MSVHPHEVLGSQIAETNSDSIGGQIASPEHVGVEDEASILPPGTPIEVYIEFPPSTPTPTGLAATQETSGDITESAIDTQ